MQLPLGLVHVHVHSQICKPNLSNCMGYSKGILSGKLISYLAICNDKDSVKIQLGSYIVRVLLSQVISKCGHDYSRNRVVKPSS